MHHVVRAEEITYKPAYPRHSAGYKRHATVDRSTGSTHTGMGLCSLASGGRVDLHVQSFEEYFYITHGEPTLLLDGVGYPLLPGSCGVVPVGAPHAWLGPASGTATDGMAFATESGFATVSSSLLALPAAGAKRRPVWRFAAGRPGIYPFEKVDFS